MNPELNRLGNAKNPYQTETKKVLCVCSAGLLRSPTAANVLHAEYGFNTRAAGTSREYALIPVNKVLMYWADEVVCMDYDQEAILQARLEEYELKKKPIIVLDIPDCFEWNHPELQQLILTKYVDYKRSIGETGSKG